MNATVVIEAIRRYQLNGVVETDLHDALAGALLREGLDFEREVILDERNRIDFLVDDVGLEVKVNGSTTAVERQLKRYAGHKRISSLILLTSCARHAGVARELRGKRVHVVPTFGAF